MPGAEAPDSVECLRLEGDCQEHGCQTQLSAYGLKRQTRSVDVECLWLGFITVS